MDEKGTLTGVHEGEGRFKVLLAGHADEISLIVDGYNSDGSMKVQSNGGVRAPIYLGAKVRILTANGEVSGVVGVNRGLLKKGDLEPKDLFIDIGCPDMESAEKVVPKGSYIVHDIDITELQNGLLAGRAFDDRIGVYVIYEAAKKAICAGAKNTIFCTATTGEETTGRGAFSAASRLKPDVCVAVDVTFATDYSGAGESGDVKIGKGGVICHGSTPNAKLNKLLAECAAELNLPVQYEVWPGRTGTDADTMLRTHEGVPQVLFSIPLRYMHSPIEVLSIADVDSMVDVLALFLQKLDENYDLMPYSLED